MNNAGIIFFSTTNVDITNNTITGSIDHAIKVRGGNNDVTVTGNNVSASPHREWHRSCPIRSASGRQPTCTIVGNTRRRHAQRHRRQRRLDDRYAVISGNTVSNNTNGIRLTGVTASVAGGNDIIGNTGTGILIGTGAQRTVNNGCHRRSATTSSAST